MVEVIELPKMELKVKDVFSLGDMMSMMDGWLKENNFLNLDDAPVGDSNQESLYAHKVTGGGNMAEISMLWRMLKYPPESSKKMSYVRYRLHIDMTFRGDVAEVEVMHKGKKVKLNKGEMGIKLMPFLELDYRDEWEKGGLLKLVKDIFKKKIYRAEIDAHTGYFMGEVARFHSLLKQFFRLESDMAEETVAQPPKGLI